MEIFAEVSKKVAPLVVIQCLVYNHEKYLRDALEGFVMQKTNFPFIVIVHDDASKDNSGLIIKEYAVKYPDMIYPIIEKENQYAKYKSFEGVFKVVDEATNLARGKYIAICEGDDCWTDPFKLQKQVDFMEANPDVALCFHNVDVVRETASKLKFSKIEDKIYSPDEVYLDWIVPTASILMRADSLSDKWDKKYINGDIIYILSASLKGKLYGMSQTMGIYRIQPNGMTASRRRNNNLELCKNYIGHYKAIKKNFPTLSKEAANWKIKQAYLQYSEALRSNGQKKWLYYEFLGNHDNLLSFGKRMAKGIYRRIFTQKR